MEYNLYRADLGKDRERILNFWGSYHPDQPLDRKFEWIYCGNPSGQANVFIVRDGDVWIGMAVLFPIRINVAERTLRAGIAGDFFVTPDHRSAGPALLLQKSMISAIGECGLDFIYLFPNKKAEPIQKRAGYSLLGPMVRLVRVIKIGSYLGRFGIPEALGRWISPIGDFFYRLIMRETWSRAVNGCVFRDIEKADERFDRFWERCRPRFPVTVERSSAYLNWKYFRDPDDENRVLAAFSKNESELKGYVAYCLGGEEGEVEIRDFLVDDVERTGHSLMGHFLRRIRSGSAKAVSVTWMDHECADRLWRDFGFRKVREGRNIYIYGPSSVESASAISLNMKDWFLAGSEDT